MSTITKERLIKIQQWRETYGPGSNVVLPAEEAEELARIALAAQAAGPVYQWRERYVDSYLWDDCTKEQYEGFAKHPDFETRILYTAPPAPVTLPTFEEWCKRTEQNPVGWVRDTMKEAYDACRAAMLHGADGNSPVIPDGWVLVPIEPTAEMQSAAASAIRFETTPINKLWTGNAVYKAMLAAAPQQEVEL
ncbi:DUF551 domain-containing protein [Enterobacter ludwigii]|uniref:DUF551 domain-containing protein n=1 Tax=Enterobacter ludwigii TaxID=299767 RepID=UPI00343D1C4B